jgi:hypothetical protein
MSTSADFKIRIPSALVHFVDGADLLPEFLFRKSTGNFQTLRVITDADVLRLMRRGSRSGWDGP